jgi:putative transposase
VPCAATQKHLRYDNFVAQPRFVQIRTRGRLPHWQVDDAVYFVTFGLRDSIPKDVFQSIVREREHLLRTARTSTERARIDLSFDLRIDREMDAGRGSCLLRAHGELVAGALKFFDRARYELHAWCVMPTHVHVMFFMSRGADVPSVLHSWKSYVSHKIGLGAIWQREYFDRVVRTPQEYANARAYVHSNPSKAGLMNWPWVG